MTHKEQQESVFFANLVEFIKRDQQEHEVLGRLLRECQKRITDKTALLMNDEERKVLFEEWYAHTFKGKIMKEDALRRGSLFIKPEKESSQ